MHRCLRRTIFVFASVWVLGCDGVAMEEDPFAVFERDAATRRQILEGALWREELPYSQSLLANYGFGDSGWDLLREMPTASRAFTIDDAHRLADGETLELAAATEGLVPAGTPETEEAWRHLGQRVFYELPMRYDGYITWLAGRPEALETYGIVPDADGRVQGMRVYADERGQTRVGITCAFCHAEAGISGRGSRQVDLGKARGDHATLAGQDPTRFYGWGPGRIDVTDDTLDSPTAIPDLWALDRAQYVNHSGVIALGENPTGVLAARFETQYIQGHRMRSRPSRTLMWALAQFVQRLTPPADRSPYQRDDVNEALAATGEQIFADRCQSCHQPDAGYSGGLVDASALPLDGNVALTPERGTGFYKVPSLLGVRGNGPYFHDGSAKDLQALLQAGHPFGSPLEPDSIEPLRAFLNTL